MAHCKSPANCTDVKTAITIEVLPDIVGIGILTSSLITAGAAFLAVVVSYFNDLLPGEYLSSADWGFLQRFHFRKCCRARYRGLAFGRTTMCPHANPEVDSKRTSGMTAFVLSLSDQQLVIGPAMVVAAMTQYCRLSCYEFQVVTSLAFLASTTHLSTLLLLRNYFQENKTIRNLRVSAMIANLALLFYTTIITSASYRADSSARVQCVGANISTIDVVNTTVTITFLVSSYTYAISQLYRDRHHRPFRKWLQYYCCIMKSGPKLQDEEFQKWYTEKVWHSRYRPGSCAQRESYWTKALHLNALRSKDKSTRLFSSIPFVMPVGSDFIQSFLVKIFVLVISAAYSIAQVVSSRLNAPSIEGSENTLDFGQVVPIFLLLLPILTAVEMYFEIHDDKTKASQLYKSAPHAQSGLQPAPIQTNRWTSTTTAVHPTTNRTPVTPEPSPGQVFIVVGNPSSRGMDHQPPSTSVDLFDELLYPYSRPDIALVLHWMAFCLFASFVYTGMALILQGASAVVAYTISGAVVLVASLRYGRYFLDILKETRELQRANLIKPPGGTKAPPPSIMEAEEDDDHTIFQETLVSRSSRRGEDKIQQHIGAMVAAEP